MKKLSFLFGIALMALTSCSTENLAPEISSAPEAGLLVKRIISDDVSKITYDGSKIVKVEKSGFCSIYTYTGNVITKIVSTDGSKINVTEYVYENGKLKTVLEKTNNGNGATLVNSSKKEYVHDTEGNVTIKEYNYSAGMPTMSGTSKITLKNGNIVREEHFDVFGAITEVSVYEYDTLENPVGNTLGYDKLIDPTLSSKNNIMKSITTVVSGENTSTSVTTNSFTLNNDDDGYSLTVRSTKVIYYSSGRTLTDVATIQYEY